MPDWQNYKGVEIPDATPTGEAGLRLKENFIYIADQLGSGGLSITNITSNYTAAPGDLVACDVSGGSLTVSLPAITANARIGIKLEAASGSNIVTIEPDGSDEIDHQTSVVLYVENDYIEIQGNSAKGQWIIVQDGIQPHLAKMHNTATQTLSAASTYYTMQFDTLEYDTGQIANLSSDSFTIRRAGVYLINGAGNASVILDLSEAFALRPRVNGALVTGGVFFSTATDQSVSAFTSYQAYLSVGDVVTIGVAADEAGTTIPGTSTIRPYFAISEIR